MKKTTILTALMAIMTVAAFAQSKSKKHGYHLELEFTDKQDTLAYLVHYFGKPLPTIYKSDSATFNKNGVAVFDSDEEILGGIYMILLSDKQTYYEFLLNDGDSYKMKATAAELPAGVEFNKSPENERFVKYMKFLRDYGQATESLKSKLTEAKTAEDTAQLKQRFDILSADLKNYRGDYIEKYPNTLLTTVFNALKMPEVPKGPHYLEDGKTIDSTFDYKYYKAHYWDGFDFQDDRLINTPIYDGRLNEYFSNLVPQLADSITKEGDSLLARTRGSKELFKYTLWFVTRYAESSKVMGMDAAFVYFVENYYMKGDAYWLDAEALSKYIQRAKDIAPNVIGNIAPELKLPDWDGNMHSLHDFDAKYTLLIFWSPECGHCLTEMPKVDSLYRKVLKKKGVKVYAVRTEGEVDKWKETVKEKGLDDWLHVYDPERTSRFRSTYDIYSTPVIYLLDERKIIRGKRLDHTNIEQVLEMLEKQKKDKSKKS